MDQVEKMKTPPFLSGYVESRIGGRRENQDSYGYANTDFGFVVTVCDGMGGGPGGKTASTIAVREIIYGIKDASDDDTLENIIIKAVRRANLAILAEARENPALRGMGSTATVMIINEDAATIAHVGDSRVYQIRGRSKVFRTFDHSLVFDLVRQKVLNEEQARLSAQSNVITRALGMKEDVEVETHRVPYLAGDRFMLCSDGIHGSMPEPALINLLADSHHPLGVVVDEIATSVDEIGRTSGGGHDNLTLAVVKTNINSNLKEKMTSKAKLIIAACVLALATSLAFNIIQSCSSDSHSEAADEIHALRQKVSADSVRISSLSDSIAALKSKSGASLQSARLLQDKNDEIKDLRNEIDNLRKKIRKLEKK